MGNRENILVDDKAESRSDRVGLQRYALVLVPYVVL